MITVNLSMWHCICMSTSNKKNLFDVAIGLTFIRKLCIDLKWREMWSKEIFMCPKWPSVAIFGKYFFFQVAY